MKQKSKTGAWIRLVVFSILALALVNVLIAGITNRWNGFSFFSFGTSFRYPDSEKYTAGNNSITASQLKEMDINWVSGSIEIDTYEGETIEITETGNGNIGDDDRVRSYYEDGILHIQFRESTFFLFGAQTPRKTLHVKIPESLAGNIQNFALDSVSSDNSISGLSMKDCDIDKVSGELIIDGTVQNFNLNTVSGSCLLTSKTAPENINSDSVSGDICIEKIK